MANGDNSQHSIVEVNRGVFYNAPPIAIPAGGMSDCLNVRVLNGQLVRDNMGWSRFMSQVLDGPVTLIENLVLRDGAQRLILGTPKSLYRFNETGETVYADIVASVPDRVSWWRLGEASGTTAADENAVQAGSYEGLLMPGSPSGWWDFLDGGSMTLVAGNKVSAITDKSGRGLDLAQDDDALRPEIIASQINANQAAVFNGDVLDRGASNLFRNAPGTTWAAIVRYDTDEPTQRCIALARWAGTTPDAFQARHQLRITPGPKVQTSWARLDTSTIQSLEAAHPTGIAIIVSRVDYQEQIAKLWVDGAVIASKSTGQGSGNTENTDVTVVVVGATGPTASNGFIGSIGEVIAYDRGLEDQEAIDLTQHLADKWGVSLGPIGAGPGGITLGATSPIAGAAGNTAIELRGGHVDVPHNAAHALAAGTIVCHAIVDNLSERRVWAAKDGSGTVNGGWSAEINADGSVRAFIKDAGGTAQIITGQVGDVPTGVPVFLVFTWGPSGLKYYVGTDIGTLFLAASSSFSGGAASNTEPMRLGGFPGVETNKLVGKLDEVILFSRQLTVTELFQLCRPASGSGSGTTDGTVSYLNPRYETGTVATTNGSAIVTGTGTSWDTALLQGDFIHIGATGQVDPGAAWHEIAIVDSATQVTLTAAYPGATASGQDYTARRSFHGTMQDYWRSATFQRAQPANADHWYGTNGIDAPVRWDGVANQVTWLTTLGFTCKELYRFKNMLIYGNLVVGNDPRPSSIRASAIGEPENTAGGVEIVVHDRVDPVVGLYGLGDVMTVYCEKSIVNVQFTETIEVFVLRTAVHGLGSLSGRAIADFGDYHEFLAQDSQYAYDGLRVRRINEHVWREILRQQDPSRLAMTISHFDEELGELIWVFPRTTDAGEPAERAFVEHYLERPEEELVVRPYTQRSLPATALGYFDRQTSLTFAQITEQWQAQNYRWNDRFFKAAFPFNLFGDEKGKIYILNALDSHDGASLRSFARFNRFAAIDGRRKGVIRRIYPGFATSAGEITIKVRGANTTDADTRERGTFAYSMAGESENEFIAVRQADRFFEIEIEIEGVGKPFFLTGFDIEIIPHGQR